MLEQIRDGKRTPIKDDDAVIVPAGTPAETIARLHAALNGALEDATVRARLAENGVEIETSPTPADFGQFLVSERERWGVIVRRANLRAE